MKIQLKVLVLEAANKRRSAKLVVYTENIAKACTLTLYKSSTRTFALSTSENKKGVTPTTKYAKNQNGICWRNFNFEVLHAVETVVVDENIYEAEVEAHIAKYRICSCITDEVLDAVAPKIVAIRNEMYPPRKQMSPAQLNDLSRDAQIVVSGAKATILENHEGDACMRVSTKEVDGKTLYRAKLGIRYLNGVVAVTSAKIYENATTKGTKVPVQSNLYFSKVFFLATGLDVKDDTQKARDFMKILSDEGILSYNEKSRKVTLSDLSLSLYFTTRKVGQRDVAIVDSTKVLTLINRIRTLLGLITLPIESVVVEEPKAPEAPEAPVVEEPKASAAPKAPEASVAGLCEYNGGPMLSGSRAVNIAGIKYSVNDPAEVRRAQLLKIFQVLAAGQAVEEPKVKKARKSKKAPEVAETKEGQST